VRRESRWAHGKMGKQSCSFDFLDHTKVKSTEWKRQCLRKNCFTGENRKPLKTISKLCRWLIHKTETREKWRNRAYPTGWLRTEPNTKKKSYASEGLQIVSGGGVQKVTLIPVNLWHFKGKKGKKPGGFSLICLDKTERLGEVSKWGTTQNTARWEGLHYHSRMGKGY